MPENADYGRHRPWHCIVQESVTGGLGWCIDCLRVVPVEGDGPNIMRAVPEHFDGSSDAR